MTGQWPLEFKFPDVREKEAHTASQDWPLCVSSLLPFDTETSDQVYPSQAQASSQPGLGGLAVPASDRFIQSKVLLTPFIKVFVYSSLQFDKGLFSSMPR